MQLNLLETEDSIITVDIAKKPLYYGVDASSQFRKPELSCLRALPFMFILAFILFISITNVYSAQVTLEWNPNTEPDFAGHKIYSGTSSRNYDSVNDVGDLTSYTIQNLVEGQTYYIAVTAYNTFNTESDYSAEVVYTIPILDLTVPSNGSMDNDTQWTSSTGTWLVSSGANPYGANSFYSSESGATFEYIASGVNGEKEVSLWWTEWSSRCTSVQVDIYDGTTKIGTVNVNHQSNGGQWNSLGTYTFSGTARVVINSQGGCTTSADACKIAAAGTTTGSTLPTDGIMDNGSQWTSSTGTWQPSSGANPYGGGSLYSNTSDSYEYCATGVNGVREVSLWWTEWSNRCTSVQVDIYDGTTKIGTVNVNHQSNGGQWNSLGTYTFSNGTAKVVINSQGGCTTSADAMRISLSTTYDAAGKESGQSSTSSVTTTADNINHPPVVDMIANITVSEGATITLNPAATDPDGDALTYTYSGWMSSASYTTTYDDAGTHTVNVTASDGSLSDSQVVTVIINDTTPIVEKTITAGDIDGNGKKDIIIDYGTGRGIWALMNDSTWMQLHTLSSEIVTTGDIDGNGQDEVIIDGGDLYGIWIFMNNSTWAKLHDVSSEIITTGDMDGDGQDEVIIDFGDPYGISVLMNNSTWMQLHTHSPETMTTGDIDGNGQDEVILDGGDLYGISVLMNNSTWVQLHTHSPETMTTGDIDGNGQDEVIVDGGDLYGISVLMNNSTWVQLHTFSPTTMTTGDIDRNGQDEVIVDGGDLYGIWIFMNNSTWAKLHDVSSEIITTGDMDGNELDEVIIDFGDPYGISVLMNNSAWKSLTLN